MFEKTIKSEVAKVYASSIKEMVKQAIHNEIDSKITSELLEKLVAQECPVTCFLYGHSYELISTQIYEEGSSRKVTLSANCLKCGKPRLPVCRCCNARRTSCS